MDLSIIDELPKNRKPVVSKVIEEGRLESVYTFMKDEVGKGHQCMVIYPLVEESEKSDLMAAVEAHQKLDQDIFPKIIVGIIHGRMKTVEKDEIMAKFAKNEISILVSTTVIEVGVDIPNATVMLIEHAERFGLTQLHQLRGRVGRGAEKSYCIMVRRKFTETSKTRLAIMERTNDGFVIADEDLKLRGPGEFFGIRQSGFLQFRIANLLTDGPIIRSAREAAFSVAKSDPNLLNKDHKIMRETFMKDYADRMDFVQIS
jgi:ATP-dependent DNA helicase RecG